MTERTHITIITDPRFQQHDTGGGEHPEIPERLRLIDEKLRTGVLAPHLDYHAPRPAERSQLLAFHTEAWLFRFEEAVLSGRTYIDHTDNQVGYDSFDVAMLSAGSGITGIDLLEQGAASRVFCVTRPPGHHAEPGMPFGFCFFNNCVIAARYWQQRYNRRICVFDFDAHHGNGIQTAFEEDGDTLYISIHEHPSFSYPGTGWAEERGTGKGRGTILNLPLLPGADDKQVMAAMEGPVHDALSEFQPRALILAAGFDAHRQDDMSGLAYSTMLYRKIGEKVAGWARQYTGGRLLSILEGGYELSVLAECVEAYLQGMMPEE
ncbi:MAG: histone deacetylase [Desulfobulbaceae bacterium]|nr:histone deacetylase [Desulfobulbaceae bacterium]